MSSIGLLYCGAVLFLNGLMLLGHVPPRSAAVLNIFVGVLQVVTPTVLILQAGADQTALLSASGIYLFGFTYLYVAANNLFGLEPEGLGWFSAFVAVCAVAYAGLNLTVLDDPVFAAVWLAWAGLWTMFFVLLAQGRDAIAPWAGWSLVLISGPTCVVPAFVILSGHYRTTPTLGLGVAVVLAALFGVARLLARAGVGVAAAAPVAEDGVPELALSA